LVVSADGTRLHRNDFQLPFEVASTARGLRSSGSQWHVDSGAPRLVIDEPGLHVDLVMDNFYPLGHPFFGADPQHRMEAVYCQDMAFRATVDASVSRGLE
jgi:hypothetical protein